MKAINIIAAVMLVANAAGYAMDFDNKSAHYRDFKELAAEAKSSVPDVSDDKVKPEDTPYGVLNMPPLSSKTGDGKKDGPAVPLCWTVKDSPEAEKLMQELKMPARFCLDTIELAHNSLELPVLRLKGSPLSGDFDAKVSLLENSPARWAEAVVFNAGNIVYCGRSTDAEIKLQVPLAPDGSIGKDAINVRARAGYSEDHCHSEYDYRNISYVRDSEPGR